MSKSKRKELMGRGTVGKTAVVGVKDRESNEVRAEVVSATDGETLKGFVREHVEPVRSSTRMKPLPTTG